jgi:ABC-2 type transport system ATP-binding protein
MEAPVQVDDLSVRFRVPERDAGVRAALRSVVRRRYREITAVHSTSFRAERGEVVGLLGPNGAGKTTLLKTLSGLLHPTSGRVSVLGHVPQRREAAYLGKISLVMGNRNQLQWDIPALDSFEMNRAIFDIPRSCYERTLSELTELLDAGDLLRRPVRNLSLGERMKVELVGALVHTPQILFLDEPTLGLDFSTQRRLRDFILSYRDRHGASVILTSHYMADFEALSDRVILIDKGSVHFDGPLLQLSNQLSGHKELTVTLADRDVDLRHLGTVLDRQGGVVRIRIPRADFGTVVSSITSQYEVLDLVAGEPPIEDLLQLFFSERRTT